MLKIDFIDGEDVISKVDPKSFSPKEPHYSILGHKLIGEYIFKKLSFKNEN